MKGSSGGSPSSLGSTSPVTSPHRQGSSQHRNSIDAVFVDLDLSKAGDFGLQIGDVDLRALAKDRQKKDNHNMSNQTFKKKNFIIDYCFVFAPKRHWRKCSCLHLSCERLTNVNIRAVICYLQLSIRLSYWDISVCKLDSTSLVSLWIGQLTIHVLLLCHFYVECSLTIIFRASSLRSIRKTRKG